jgi:hypothetical protein
VQNLPAASFKDGRRYLQEIQVNLAKTLNPLWREIRELFDMRRSSEEYRILYRLDSSGKPLPEKSGAAKAPVPL